MLDALQHREAIQFVRDVRFEAGWSTSGLHRRRFNSGMRRGFRNKQAIFDRRDRRRLVTTYTLAIDYECRPVIPAHRHPRPSPCGGCRASASARPAARRPPRGPHRGWCRARPRSGGRRARCRRGATPGISRSHSPRNRRAPVASVASGGVQTSTWPCWARSLIGRMARLIARLISPSRARPSRSLAASTMSRNFSAAGDTQRSRSPSQSASCTISSSRRRCTPSHLSRSPPPASEDAGSPNGSADR